MVDENGIYVPTIQHETQNLTREGYFFTKDDDREYVDSLRTITPSKSHKGKN